ncbi:MAG: phage shock protein PspA [Kiloniellales bacterium]|nr:phage shock protein PspA [Kiloniellales bacterium]
MSIFSRLADIINSNINAILDRAEEPEKIIRLIIQEMEDTLVEVRTNAARSIADKKAIARKLDQVKEAQEEWARRAELALEKGREDLAKAALLEKAKLADTAGILEQELVQVEEAIVQGDADIAKLQAKLAEAKAKQKAIVTRQEAAGSRLKVRTTLQDGRVDDALARFEQVERKLDEAEGRVEAFDLGQRKTLAEEIAALEAESAIEAELESLKDRIAARDKR